MKKISHIDKWKKIIIWYKRHKHNLNRKRIWKKHWQSKQPVTKNNIVKIICPENYSFIDNTENFISHLNEAKRIARAWKNIHFNLDNITHLSFDALCVLMAETKNKEVFNIVEWSMPKNKELRMFFERSGFINRLEGRSWNEWEMFNYNSNKSYSQEFSESIIKIVEQYTFNGNKQQIQAIKLHPFFVEAMTNTNNHAGNGYNWWIFYYKWDKQTIKICFLDLWAGIIKTLTDNLGFFDLERLNKEDECKKFKDLFEWRVQSAKKRTKTSENNRWTWLPLIYSILRGEYIHKAYAISNNVKIDITNNVYTKLNNISFNGTLYYFEISNYK